MKHTLFALFLLSTTTTLIAGEDEGFVIGVRKNRIWFAQSLLDDAFRQQAVEAAKLLRVGKLDYEAQAELTEGLQRDRARSAKEFGALLDARKTTDANVRLGAVKALALVEPEAAKPEAKVMGKMLSSSALMETEPKVRGAVIELIKSRRDIEAERDLVRAWHSAFEDEALGVNEALRTAAENAMRDVGSKRIFEAMYYYVTMEIRAQTASLDRLDTVHIRNAGQNVAGTDRAGTINLPIDLPSLNLSSVETTLVVPALPSMKRISGHDFGRDLGQWKAWIDGLP